MLTEVEVENGLAVIGMGARSPAAQDLSNLRALLDRLSSQGIGGALFDMSSVRRLSYEGIAALLELTASPVMRVAFCHLQAGPKERLASSGIAAALPLYDTVACARESDEFKKLRLVGCRAVILSAGKGSRLAPLTEETPKPMLDLLGRPVLDHIIGHLQSFGIREYLINPGHLGMQIPAHFNRRRDVSVFYTHEGQMGSDGWSGEPIGSASTLARLQRRHSALPDDTIVMCGDALIDLDMAELMAAHRASGAEVTIAAKQVPPDETQKYGIIVADADGRISSFQEKPASGEARSTLANVGVYVISPRAVARLADQPGLDIASDLLPAILANGGHIQVHAPDFSWVDIGCGKDYYRAVEMGLRGLVPGVTPLGQEIQPNVWIAPGATVSPRARLEGPCYIGPDAYVHAGSEITGPSVVGANTIIEPRAVVRNSILRPDTHVVSGAYVDSMIAGPRWAVAHQHADGSPQNRSRLERVRTLEQTEAQNAIPAFQVASIA